jgi:hypothetical protein
LSHKRSNSCRQFSVDVVRYSKRLHFLVFHPFRCLDYSCDCFCFFSAFSP